MTAGRGRYTGRAGGESGVMEGWDSRGLEGSGVPRVTQSLGGIGDDAPKQSRSGFARR